MQLATCADDFLGAVLRDWVQIDPACNAHEAPSTELRRVVREQLRSWLGDVAAVPVGVDSMFEVSSFANSAGQLHAAGRAGAAPAWARN